ncbi:hypothetical protein Tco_1223213, partial [Tanacetum coccineum]
MNINYVTSYDIDAKVKNSLVYSPVGYFGLSWSKILWFILSSYARVMIELRAVMELKDNIVVAMSKITREGHYTCNVSVEYEWKPPRCSSCKVFRHVHEECPKNICASKKKTVKKPSQTTRGVL